MARVSVNSKTYDYFAQEFNPNPPHFDVNKPTIIPIGFDCGPSVLLSGNLDDSKDKKDKKKSEITQYNFYDLPFSTILTKHIPTVFDLILKNTLKDPLTLLEELKKKYGLRFSHINSYSKENPIVGTEYNKMFIDDMVIRIRNLQQIMEIKKNFKIFYRKSHSCCHHNSEYNYDYVTKDINDIEDSIALSRYLKENDVNFKIVLFLCCNFCYGDKKACKDPTSAPEKGIINDSGLFNDHNILCIKTLYKNLKEELPYSRTIPGLFKNISRNLFKTDFQLNERTNFEEAREASLEKDNKDNQYRGSRGRGSQGRGGQGRGGQSRGSQGSQGRGSQGRGSQGSQGREGKNKVGGNLKKQKSKKNKIAYRKNKKTRLNKK